MSASHSLNTGGWAGANSKRRARSVTSPSPLETIDWSRSRSRRAAGRILPYHCEKLLAPIGSDILTKDMKYSSSMFSNPIKSSPGSPLWNQSILVMGLLSSMSKPADGRGVDGFAAAPEGTPIPPPPPPRPFNIPPAPTPAPKNDGLWFKVACA